MITLYIIAGIAILVFELYKMPGMYLKQFNLYVLMISLVVISAFTGCHKNEIQLQTVTQTSEYLDCDKVFSKDRKSITELSEILIQTGKIDTLEDRIAEAAVIHIYNHEVFLDLKKSSQVGTSTTEIYTGKGYKLILKYKPAQIGFAYYYDGEMEIWKGEKYTKMAIQGVVSKL